MVQIGQVQHFGDLQQLGIFRPGNPPPLQLAIEDLAPELDRGRMLLDAEALANLVTRSSGSDVSQPVPARLRRRRCDDLHGLRVLELPREARDAAVNARSLAMEADFGMHGEREVDRCRVLRQLDDVAGGRENEDLVLIEVELEEFEEFVGRLRVELQLEYLPEPLKRAIQLVRASRIFLEAPVRGNSVLRGAVHLTGSDLDLEQLPSRPEHSRICLLY